MNNIIILLILFIQNKKLDIRSEYTNMDIEKMKASAEKLTSNERAIIIFEYVVNGLSTREIEEKHLGMEDRKGWTVWGVLQSYEIKKDFKGKYNNVTFAAIKTIVESSNWEDVCENLMGLEDI